MKKKPIIVIIVVIAFILVGIVVYNRVLWQKSYAGSSVNSSGMVIGEKSLGPVSIGMSRDDMLKVLGKPDQEDAGTYRYFGSGVEVFVTKGKVRGLFAHARVPDSDRRGFNNYESFLGATDKGVKIGSPGTLVESTYGKPQERRKQPSGEQLVYEKPPITFSIAPDGNIQLIYLRAN